MAVVEGWLIVINGLSWVLLARVPYDLIWNRRKTHSSSFVKYSSELGMKTRVT